LLFVVLEVKASLGKLSVEFGDQLLTIVAVQIDCNVGHFSQKRVEAASVLIVRSGMTWGGMNGAYKHGK
jgi:hypothetical protein